MASFYHDEICKFFGFLLLTTSSHMLSRLLYLDMKYILTRSYVSVFRIFSITPTLRIQRRLRHIRCTGMSSPS